MRTGSETMRPQLLAVALLIAGRTLWVCRVGERLLFNDDPAAVFELGLRCKDTGDVDVAVAERAEGLTAPDVLDRGCLGHDVLELGLDASCGIEDVQRVSRSLSASVSRRGSVNGDS